VFSKPDKINLFAENKRKWEDKDTKIKVKKKIM